MIKNIDEIIKIVKEECSKWENPIVTQVSDLTKDPFKVLISCVLSLRTRDQVTGIASKRLFEKADTPEKLIRLEIKEVEKIIYPVGFYKTKARNLKEICKELIERYKGKVPNNFEELMKLKGVGRKTANIVMIYGFKNKEHIAVDTHCHRIPNRLGWIKTKTPEETEMELLKILPKKYWFEFNDLFVKYGQNLCKPVGPRCDICKINKYCDKIGVKNRR